MIMIVQNDERAALATWLIPNGWGGTEEQLSGLLDVYEAFKLDDYKPFFGPQGLAVPQGLLTGSVRMDVRPELATLILTSFPGQATPGPLGPAKVRLLRKLRQVSPSEAAVGENAAG